MAISTPGNWSAVRAKKNKGKGLKGRKKAKKSRRRQAR